MWLRPHERANEPQMFVDGFEPGDVIQVRVISFPSACIHSNVGNSGRLLVLGLFERYEIILRCDLSIISCGASSGAVYSFISKS